MGRFTGPIDLPVFTMNYRRVWLRLHLTTILAVAMSFLIGNTNSLAQEPAARKLFSEDVVAKADKILAAAAKR